MKFRRRLRLAGTLAAAMILALLPGNMTVEAAKAAAEESAETEQTAETENTAETERKTLADYEEILDYTSDIAGYQEYIKRQPAGRLPGSACEIPADAYTAVENMTVRTEQNYEGSTGTSLYTEETGLVEYQAEIPESGMYRLALEYYPVRGKNSPILRSIFIDGELPYRELALVEFPRIWKNDTDVWQVDNQGNDMKPNQIEAPEWITRDCFDREGYISEPLQIYLEAGTHTISIVSRREPVLLKKLILYNEAPEQTYAEICKAHPEMAEEKAGEACIEIQAETAVRKSSQMLYPKQDQSSRSVYPYSAKELKNNSIGGESNWDQCGQWIEWEFPVEEDGWYEITLREKQNFVKGTGVSRKIMLDGKVPYKELNAYGITYRSGWVMDTLSDDGGEPYLFRLSKGTHTLRMEVVLGELGGIIGQTKDVLNDLNRIYRKIICITGVSPDDYRDYQIEDNLPELEGELKDCELRIDDIIKALRTVTHKGSDKEAVLVTMRDQLKTLSKDVETVGKYLSDFKTNISAVGTWITQVTPQPLQLDAIYVSTPDAPLPKLRESFGDKLVHETKKLFWSFLVDYNAIGNVAEDSRGKTITVWIGSGRDQANVLKRLIDENFTPETGINVNVMLVDMNSLLQATLAGQGPDVALQVGNDLPMNYGLRDAALDLTEVADEAELLEIKSRFRDSAFAALEYEGSLYALPETENCQMMFYRKDIMKELGIRPPKTWDEMKVVMSVLNNNQMTLGMMPTEQLWASILYQSGGDYYTEDAKQSALNSTEAIAAFKEFTEYYTDYKLDRETNLAQGFRTGEMPIIIADSSTYTTLQVSAPEIKGLWGFTTLPGVEKEDGSIDYTCADSGSAAMIMNDSEEKEASWEFLKWWVSQEAQTSYGLEMESLMGASARYMTANVEAFGNLPWPVEDYLALSKQFDKIRGIRQVPGGYFTWRNVNNAFYRVVVSTDEEWMAPREALTEYVNYINDEITYKRNEFGMETAGQR